MPFLKHFLLVSLLLLTIPARATVMLTTSVEKMTGRATVIAIAEVKDKLSRWTPDYSKIETYVKLKVNTFLKGQRKDRMLILHQWGGQVGRLAQEIHGNPGFQIGEKVLVFLRPRKGFHRVVAMAQGKWKLGLNRQGTRKVFKRNLKGITFAVSHRTKGGIRLLKRQKPKTEWRYGKLLGEIQSALVAKRRKAR